jgi:hypothetical protein
MNKYLIALLTAGLLFIASCSSEKKAEPEKEATTIEELEDEIKEEKSQEELTQADTASTEEATEEKTDETKTEDAKPQASSNDYSQNPLKGYVVSLKDVAFGADGKINKDQAKALLDKGNTIGVKAGNKLYVVYHENGAYAGDKIHNYANRGTVGLYGKAVSKNGVNAFIMTRIVSLD